MLHQPFFGALVLKLKLLQSDEIDTMATNGTVIYFGSKFVDTYNSQQLKAVLAHEVMHCVFQHMTRRGDRDPQKWNMACDYAINLICKDAGFDLPGADDGHICLDEKYRGMTAEHIYGVLPEPPQGWGMGPGGVLDHNKNDKGEKQQGNGQTAVDRQQVEIDWEVSVKQAAQQAKAMGHLPGGLEQILGDFLEPKVDWRSKLRNFMQTAKDDYSWSRPNRRFIAQGLYLPSMWSERVGEIVVAIDSSGSVSDAELKQFLSEMSSIIGDCDPVAVHMIVCDTQVNNVTVFTKEDMPLKHVKIGGRGGTLFSPVFNYVAENDIHPEALVYLTDLESSDFGEEPTYPVMWISTCKGNAPWGEITYI